MAHFARNNNVITRKHLIDIILKNEMDEFCIYASDYKYEIDHVKLLMDDYVDIMDTAGFLARNLRKLPRKEAADIIKQFHIVVQPIMFANLERSVSGIDYVLNWDVYRWERTLDRFTKFLKQGGM